MSRQKEAEFAAALAARDVETLVRLYRETGEDHVASGDIGTGCFYLTHAYVWALEAGLSETDQLRDRLMAFGREE